MTIKKIQRADGVRYQVYGRRDGQKVYVGSYDSQRAAREADEDFASTQRKIERGELPPGTDAKRTFGVAVAAWLKSLEAAGSRSHDEYAARVELHMLPTFRDVPIVSIQRASVIEWREKLHERVSASTVNTITGTLSSAFSYFVDHAWVAANPCARIKSLKHDARVFPWLDSPDAITRLLAEMRPNIRTLCAVLVGTGMRLDEALHLRWDDVDLEHRLIAVHRGSKGTTKSGKARRVPIFDAVLPVLKAMKLARGHNVLLWPGAKRGRPLSQPSVRVPFKDAADRAGLPKELRVHDLRHTFASLFLVDGGDIFKLSRILGHSSVKITADTYAHLKPTAYVEDYGRVRFTMPNEATVLKLSAT